MQSQSSSILGAGSVNYACLLWACMVLFLLSTFFDHRFLMITLTTILQGILPLGRTQISHKSFHLKNQLSQNLFLQINHLPTQVHCCTALIPDSTRENQKQMVRWLSSVACWFCFSLPVNMWAALTYLKTGSCCLNLAVLTEGYVYFFPSAWQDWTQFICRAWCCCFLLWLYLHIHFKTLALISEIKLILHFFQCLINF